MKEIELAGGVPATQETPAEAPAAARRVADEVLRRFGAGTLLEIEIAPGGMLNQNLFGTTARGTFFLKGYRYSDPTPIAREHRLIEFAHERGVPALMPLRTSSGQTYVRVGGRFWSVFPRVEDAQLASSEMTPDHAHSMGTVLGAIHIALAAFPPLELTRFPTRLGWNTAQAAADMADYEAFIARKLVPDPFDQHALSSFAYRRTLMAGGVPAPETFALLPSQLQHGDYHAGNVFFGQDRAVSAVIDWELAGTGPRAWEIVRALDLAFDLQRDLDAGAPLLQAFIHGYASVAPLSAEECTAMPEMYWAARVHTLWVYDEHYRKGSARTDRLAMEYLDILQWLTSNRQRVAEALRNALSSAPGPRFG